MDIYKARNGYRKSKKWIWQEKTRMNKDNIINGFG